MGKISSRLSQFTVLTYNFRCHQNQIFALILLDIHTFSHNKIRLFTGYAFGWLLYYFLHGLLCPMSIETGHGFCWKSRRASVNYFLLILSFSLINLYSCTHKLVSELFTCFQCDVWRKRPDIIRGLLWNWHFLFSIEFSVKWQHSVFKLFS